MAGKNDIRAGGAFVELFTKDAALIKGLKSAQKQLQGFGKNVMAVGGFFTGLGAAMLAPLAGAVSHFVSAGSALNDLSERTGLAASNLAELKYAAEQSGAGLEDIEVAIKNMQKKGLKETFDQAAARIAAIADPAARAKAAIDTFGKAGTKLIPMLGTLQELRQQARELGLVPTDEAVKSADALGDAFDQVKSVVGAALFEIGAAMAPVLLPLATTIRNIIGQVNRWIRENGQLVRTVAMVGAGLLAAGVVITAIGAGIFGLGAAAGIAATVLTTIGSVVAAIVSPIGLVTIGLAAAAFAFFRFTETGRSAVSSLLSFFAPLIQTVRTTIGGIADALMAGDLALAGQIAVTGLKVVFLQGLASLSESIGGTLGDVVGTIGKQLLEGDLAGAWQTVVSGIAKLWADFAEGIVAIFTMATRAIIDAWQSTQNTITDSLLDSSASGGVMGKIASMILGVDLAEEQRRSDALNSKLGLKPTDVAGEAKKTARQQSQATADVGRSLLDTLDRQMQGRSDRAGDDFRERVGGGSKKARDEAERLAKELDDLKKQASAAREAAQAGGTAGGQKPPDAAALKASSTVTGFSGAALLLSGQGGGAQEMGLTLRQQLLVQKNQEKHLKRIAEKEGAVAK